MRVAILSVNQKSLCQAHSILDTEPNSLITLYSEDAEAGFTENPPEPIVLNEILGSISSEWYGFIPDSVDRVNPSSTSSSWLIKSLAIRLAERGVNFLLHTRIIDIDEENQEISFRGGGAIASGTQKYDELYDFQ